MESIHKTSRTEVHGKAAVAGSRRLITDTATAILEKGGNAVDAGVAAAFVAGVIEPMETTLAGSGFMLVGEPDGKVHSVEFAPRAPKRAHKNMFTIDKSQGGDRGLGVSTVVDDANVQGALAAGIPATLRGLVDAHSRFGKLKLKDIMRPAIFAAQDGFEVDNYYVLETLDNLRALRENVGARKVFLVNGEPPKPVHLGRATLSQPHVVKQKKLAQTLEAVAEKGVGYFYDGPLGEQFVETHKALGGIVRVDDLKAVETIITTPRVLNFRGAQVWMPNAPSGAITQLEILNIWKHLYPKSVKGNYTVDNIINLARVCWHAFADRYYWLGDPDFVSVPEQGLLSDAYAKDIAAKILNSKELLFPVSAKEAPWNYFASHAENNPLAFDEKLKTSEVNWNPAGSTDYARGTTHISVTDEDGMMVSITHTAANHFGSKVVCEHTGLLLDAAMGWFNAEPNAANSIAGGKRPLANMGPALITRNGVPCAALGAPGGRRIICAVVQLILNLIEKDMTALEAVTAPRLDASGWSLLLSERLAPMVGDLNAKGMKVTLVDEQHEGFGYEFARPVVVTRKSSGAEASVDPFSKGFARSIR